MTRQGSFSKKLEPFGTSIFTEMSALANRHGAIDLAQGFPDFAGPDRVKEAACRAEVGKGLVRFSFCKKLETIRAAGEKLASLSEVLAR